ncbi:MAG: AbrB/MazE/SpoVT family DNA-binding domain-containing protein, partial [Nitrospirota bacterium]
MTRKGQVTIPKAIRDRLGVKEGEKVLFVMRGEEVVLKVIKGTILD